MKNKIVKTGFILNAQCININARWLLNNFYIGHTHLGESSYMFVFNWLVIVVGLVVYGGAEFGFAFHYK
ncbi:MAG: hypothetical protein M3Z92_10995 [Bacteroidota bacterium]|nr:hypothetical protein [Bacteroidota bacterium]